MKRELMQLEGKHLLGCWCCPGHDKWPNDTYRSNRSKRARSRDKQKEHKLARTVAKRSLFKQLIDVDNSCYNAA